MFDSLLIANRGEIAWRIMRTAKRLGLRTIAVYSDADRGALHVERADASFRIGPAPARQSYLDPAALLAAAAAASTQAIHPGYGFLAENADFAEACEAADLRFVGPPPAAIRAMGSKAEARAIMARAGVPVLPGYHGAGQDAQTLSREAQALGYPVMIKAHLGGGGKGMRLVRRPEEFAASLEGARREAAASFGDDRMLIEKAVDRPRHVEVQILADGYGRVLHLFERDCSLQRRHQKVVEEAPAPDLDEGLRSALVEAATAAARAIGYEGAGTVEFIVECGPSGIARGFYFLEMNTRLQVEHPVTELITGLDLVEWQLRVAAGEPLPFSQDAIRCTGHGIEARLYAEDPARGFVPAAGTLHHLVLPEEGPELRVDTGVREGDVVGVDYDPIFAKIAVWGDDRDLAVRRLGAALRATEVGGVVTNRDFLIALAAHRRFRAGACDTGFIDAGVEELVPDRSAVDPKVMAIASLFELLHRERAAAACAQESEDPWSPWHRTDAWRLGGRARDVLTFVDGEQEIEVTVGFEDGEYRLDLPGSRLSARGSLGPKGRMDASLDGLGVRATVIAHGSERWIIVGGSTRRVFRKDPDLHAAGALRTAGRLSAPMPGKVSAVHVRAGERVRSGRVLMVLEAMKMEHAVSALRDGVVERVCFSEGEQVAEGDELLVFAEEEGR